MPQASWGRSCAAYAILEYCLVTGSFPGPVQLQVPHVYRASRRPHVYLLEEEWHKKLPLVDLGLADLFGLGSDVLGPCAAEVRADFEFVRMSCKHFALGAASLTCARAPSPLHYLSRRGDSHEPGDVTMPTLWGFQLFAPALLALLVVQTGALPVTQCAPC